MENPDVAFEAEVELDGEALRQERERQRNKRAEKAAVVAAGGIDTSPSRREDGEQEEADESSPLLPRENGDDQRKLSSFDEDFAHLPWYKRPSIFWVLFPFFLMTCAFGGVITPKINLILELVCKQYISDRQLADPGFTMVPVDFGGDSDNDQCRIPEVQARVAQFTLWGSLIAGLLSAIMSPKLGALSDRYGRRPILMITSMGTICGEILTIAAATYPETFPVDLLLLGFALDGLTGSFIVAMAIANSYAADCTPPARRNVAFGYFHGCLFTGIALGPILAGYMVKVTGKIVIVFYVLTAVHLFFVAFVGLVVPESLSKRRQLAAREKHKKTVEEFGAASDWLPSQLRSLNLLEPLKVLWPTGPGSSPALRRNLFFLAAVDTIVFGVAMGSLTLVVIYTNYQFGWKSFESARFMTIVNSSRVFCLLVILPIVTRLVRGKPDAAAKQKSTGCDMFDVYVIRVAVLFDTIGYLGYTFSRTGGLMILSGAVAAVGGIGSPTLQSALTKHVPAEKTGQLLGASGLLHALARVVAPTTFNAIYSLTVGKFTQTVFVCLSATFGVAFVITWFLKTHSKPYQSTFLSSFHPYPMGHYALTTIPTSLLRRRQSRSLG